MTALSLTSLPHHVLSLLIPTYFTAAFTVDLLSTVVLRGLRGLDGDEPHCDAI